MSLVIKRDAVLHILSRHYHLYSRYNTDPIEGKYVTKYYQKDVQGRMIGRLFLHDIL